jgi:hypothetical protein
VIAAFVSLMAGVLALAFRERRVCQRIDAADTAAQAASPLDVDRPDHRAIVTITAGPVEYRRWGFPSYSNQPSDSRILTPPSLAKWGPWLPLFDFLL